MRPGGATGNRAGLGLRPRESLEEVFLSASELQGPSGTIPAENLVITSVEGFHGSGRQMLMRLGQSWNMSAYGSEHFWCTVKVPTAARPGL
jgi:hypothetical protein